MRLGLIADVHANARALDAVLADARRQRIDGWLCAGDLVGYGPGPNEAVARLAALEPSCVAGNHDLIAIGALGTERCSPRARESLERTRAVLDDAARRYLESLPLRAEAHGVTIAHGGLGDPRLYVLTESAALAQLALLSADGTGSAVLMLGHTHRPMACGERRGLILHGGAGTVSVQPGERVVVNPGSVGQARQGRALARWAVMDLEARTVTFRKVGYDTRAVRRELRRAGLPRDSHRPRRKLRYVLLPTAARRPLGRVRRRLFP